MDRPKIIPYTPPTTMSEIPFGSTFACAHLVEKNAGWRTFRPVVDPEKCTGCLRCYLLCPDGVIYPVEKENAELNRVDNVNLGEKKGKKAKPEMTIDYDFCKGCGICAKECKFDAVTMEKEEL